MGVQESASGWRARGALPHPLPSLPQNLPKPMQNQCSFTMLFGIEFWSILHPRFAPKAPMNVSNIDAKMHSVLGFVYRSIVARLLLPTSTPKPAKSNPRCSESTFFYPPCEVSIDLNIRQNPSKNRSQDRQIV